jgi:hypothetical protein
VYKTKSNRTTHRTNNNKKIDIGNTICVWLKENKGTKKYLAEQTVSSLVAAFDCEMDSSTIQLSRKRASCVAIRDMQVICYYGMLLFLFICLYLSHSVVCVCVNYPKKNRQQQQATTNNDDMSYVQ